MSTHRLTYQITLLCQHVSVCVCGTCTLLCQHVCVCVCGTCTFRCASVAQAGCALRAAPAGDLLAAVQPHCGHQCPAQCAVCTVAAAGGGGTGRGHIPRRCEGVTLTLTGVFDFDFDFESLPGRTASIPATSTMPSEAATACCLWHLHTRKPTK